MAALLAAATEGLRMFEPPAPLTLSQWSDEYLYLSPESSAMPGKFERLTPSISAALWMPSRTRAISELC